MPAIRADFTRAVCVAPDAFQWTASPGGEVQRVMLDRVGDEVAVATSLVRYPPGSRFPAHEHGLGEEFLVLEGEFADEHDRYPPGTYVRNPPGSRHAPFSDPGCVIWVKLRQFHPDDGGHTVARLPQDVPGAGTESVELHRFRDEAVTAVAAASGALVSIPVADQVQEVLVARGAVRWGERSVGRWGWLRVPAGEGVELVAAESCLLLHKVRPAVAVPGPGQGAGDVHAR